MKTIKKFGLAGVFMALIALSACTKNDLSPNTEETALATDNARMDNESDNIGTVINAIAYSNNLSDVAQKLDGAGKIFGNVTLPECAVVTVDTISNPKSITVNFGSTPCLCDEWDGMYRQGVVKATWTGNYKETGTVITITTTDYYRGITADQMDKIEATKVVTNIGPNANGNFQFHIVATIKIYYFTGETSDWNVDKIKEWSEGQFTADINDDVFVITGTVNGTNRNGLPVSGTITTPIVKNSCDWYVSGVMEITRGNFPQITLDYGNGTCDDQATVTVNGNTKTITLK